MQTGNQKYSYTDVVETRKQTPISANAINVIIGPGDPISNIPVVMEFAHHQVHEGETYQAVVAPVALANGNSLLFRIVVPTGVYPHMIAELDSTGETWWYLYESPTITGNGVAITAQNRNRNSLNAPGTVVYSGATASANGTLLSALIIGSGEKAGGNGRESLEWLLKPTLTYLVVITAKNANSIAMRFSWYEDLGV